MTLLSVKDMKTNIGQYSVLHGISFDVPEGGVFVLLGRNGAGKTTTLRSIMGLWQPSANSVSFQGQDLSGMGTADIARKGIAYVPENMGIFGGLTVEENLILATAKGTFDQKRLQRIYDLFPAIEKFWTKQAWSLSGGQKQMLAVARAIIEPRALILIDEPTKGLAPSIVAAMGEAFREISQSTTILLVEQNFNFARSLGRDMAVIEDGRVVHTGSMAGFAADTELQGHLLGLSA
ncbi:ABC transporter ATP-binding protein [Pelagimonas varians]|uniref:High-affinity branched-chain amino acid transport ATP-binding protein LivF n=1 Tax=Pelagimonas varians TaxID=696760 RepID=A0A238KS61_9RHOB|nr:ABC transporter ATP-binding protein [Pelagimonas varians]PYG32492.1 amino acid/amide ABC transporter ATP-binding protein 2 (HAAT family) [Pelagimonas varians]SMX45673.1 High-affinity branched-chain amino acid transport ATP-binding protein LivF [Pelagimonas varians]